MGEGHTRLLLESRLTQVRGFIFGLAGLCVCLSASWAAQAEDLTELSLEDLLNIEVTSVSKKLEKRTQAPAAIFVLTNEDIRRLGVTTIPDALRHVPGLAVARQDANKWSVASRGFSGRFSNKLLVLIDGRSVYTPLFSGVYWENNDVMLEDVDRIEIIRGSGGTMWGANAVNGVINIVTKHSKDTQGGLITGGGGTEEELFGAFRYGGKVRDMGHYRAYIKHTERDTGRKGSAGVASDDWQTIQGGFRFDLNVGDSDTLTIQGDAYDNETNDTQDTNFLRPPQLRRHNSTSHFKGGNVLARWIHTISDKSNLQIQVYFDRYTTSTLVAEEQRNTYDFDFQHRVKLGAHNELVWGAGFRLTKDNLPVDLIFYSTNRRTDRIFSAFIQDEITINDKLKLILGSKFEDNSYTGFEFQPSIRLVYSPNDDHTLWAAVSRAVRTPSRVEDDIHLVNQTLPGPIALVLIGDRSFESEDLLAIEAGYRVRVTKNLALDIAVFYNIYDDLRTIEVGFPRIAFNPLPIHLIIPASAKNNMEAVTYGVEVVLDWLPKPWWRVRATYSFLEIDLDSHAKSIDFISGAAETDTPEQQFMIQNNFDLPRNVEFDAVIRWMDQLPSLGVEDYVTLDLRLGWKPRDGLDLSIVGQNLLDHGRTEFASTFVSAVPTEVRRGVFGKVTWEF